MTDVTIKPCARLAARSKLVAPPRWTWRRDLANQLRGVLRSFGLRVGKVFGERFDERVRELVDGCAELTELAEALLTARQALAEQIDALHTRLLQRARREPVCRRLMTVPGVGEATT